MAKAKHWTQYITGRVYGFRSGLEDKISRQLRSEGIEPKYETLKLPYTETKKHTYTPDFPVTDKIIIETKGWFQTDDRMKMLAIKEQYPDIDFRFVFNNSNAKIRKGSKTSYGDWCRKYGFKYADKTVPKEWLDEIKERITDV